MDWNGKRVLVAGASGLIGSHLTRRLAEQGARVRATWLRYLPQESLAEVEFIRADLTNAAACQTVVKDMQYIFLCAASTHGAATIAAQPMLHVTPNILINTQMLAAAYAAGVEKFFYMGSTVAYPPSDAPMREEQLFEGEPFEKYFFAGWMKRFTEVLCQMYGEKLARRMPCIVLRATNVYGPGDKFDFATSHFLPALVRRVVERHNPIEVWGTGNDVRDLIYVDDMVDALLLAAEKVNQYRAFNIGSGKGHSVREVLDLILQVDGYKNAQVRFDASKPSMIPIRLIETERAEKELGFKARIELKEGLARTISWYRKCAAAPQ